MSSPHITVSYNGGEKRVSLTVQPSLELSDAEVDLAEGELRRLLRKLFNVEQNTAFYLHEVESGRVMSKESFREPGYCSNFPTHWYLEMDSYPTSNGSAALVNTKYDGVNHLSDDLSHLGEVLPPHDLEESGLPSLADLSTTDLKYQSYSMKGTGNTGCSLRYFSIQPVLARPETPVENAGSARRDSYLSTASVDSLDALRLSTTFVGDVREGSMAHRAGLEKGFVVHMINKDSILRCNVDQTQALVDQCGEEVTLLGLPQDNDDLQFLYSQYTNKAEGQFNTDEGLITVKDIPISLRPKSPSAAPVSSNGHTHSPPLGHSPPVGMMPFMDHSPTSLDNSLSCDLSAGVGMGSVPSSKPGTEDILILGSLSEIGTQEVGKWGEDPSLPLHSDSSLSASHPPSGGLEYPANAHAAIEKAWYCQEEEEEELYMPPANEDSSLQPDKQSSSQSSSSSRRIRKSLEALTTLSTSQEVEGSGPTNHYNSTTKNWRSESFTSSHGCPSSDNSQLSAGSTSRPAHLSSHSLDMSGESAGSGGPHSTLEATPQQRTPPQTVKAPQAPRSKAGARGYRERRKKLHESKSRTAISESDTPTSELQQSWGEGEVTEDSVGPPERTVVDHTHPPSLNPSSSGRAVPAMHSAAIIPIVRHRSVKEKGSDSPSIPSPKIRPLSAVDPHSVKPLTTNTSSSSLHVPGSASSTTPLFHTITTLTPSGEAEVFREVDIGEAINRSQGGVLSAQDHGVDTVGMLRKPFTRHKSVDMATALSPMVLSGGGSLANSVPASSQPREIMCRGTLSIKQELSGLGKKAQDRSWRSYYAVLADTTITFYKDRRESVLQRPCEEPPLEVVPATVDLETKNTKRKFVFRLMTSQGQTCFLQAEDGPSRERWIDFIQQLNQKHSKHRKQLQMSPLSQRRNSSPQPSKQSSWLLGRIKKQLKKHREGDVDFSSFTAFGQPLQDCPVSPDNKRVPLVIEFCVKEVEEYGLTIEGIYRKPGMVALINNMSAQMDKGNYTFEHSDYGSDIHTVASLLKKFLKDLPDALIPDHMYEHFQNCARIPDPEIQLNTLKELVVGLPTAHYHTLRFLMKHLAKIVAHSDQNKMTLRNVALVFGPTLMRSSADGEKLLISMTASYTTVELLCKHIEFLCGDELCAEEVANQEKAMAAADQEELVDTELQKDQALANASPQTVRRIKNRFPSDTALKRHSSSHADSLGAINKLDNRSGSATLASGEPSYLHASDSNLASGSAPFLHGEGDGSKRRVRHDYEDVDIIQKKQGAGPGADQGKPNPRTINWIKHHNEMNWGRGGEEPQEREVSGSMWAQKNKVQRRNSKEKVRNGGGRRLSKSKSDQGKEALATYQGGPPRHPYLPPPPSLQQTPSSVPQPQGGRRSEDRSRSHHTLLERGVISPLQQQHQQQHAMQQHATATEKRSRRISYMNAMNDPSDLPVRESSNSQHRRGPRAGEEHFSSSSDYLPSYATTSRPGTRHTPSPQQQGGHYYPRPAPHHMSMGGMPQAAGSSGKYSSLQRDMVSPPSRSTGRRRSSDSSEPPPEHPHMAGGGGRYHPHTLHPPMQGHKARRTFSNDRAYATNNSPPQREHVESYL